MKNIPYGLSDFKRVVSHYYYIDKTKYIPLLEQYGNFLYLIRPRRFGKSLFLNMLDFYYNKKYENEFDLLKGLYIHSNPTPLKNKFCVMKFDFSAVSTKGDVDENFSIDCNFSIKRFVSQYNFNIDVDLYEPAHLNLKKVFEILKEKYPDINIFTATIFINPKTEFIPDFYLHKTEKWVNFFWENF